MMTDKWFDEFLYQIVVPKSMLSEDLVRVVDEDHVRGEGCCGSDIVTMVCCALAPTFSLMVTVLHFFP